MRCFQHQAEEAVGVCRGCGKAVCPICSVDTGVGLACSGTCSSYVQLERSLVARSRSVMSGSGRFNVVMGALFAVPSGLFVVGHLLAGSLSSALLLLPLTAFGILFIAWGRHMNKRRPALGASAEQRTLPENG